MEKTVKINLYGEKMKIDLPKKYEQFLFNIINLLNIDNHNIKSLVIFYYVQGYKKSKKIFISNSNDYNNFLDYYSHDYVKIFVRISDEYLENKILKQLEYEKKHYYKKNKDNDFYNHSHSKYSNHSHSKHRERSKKKEDKIRNFYEERRKVRERSRSNSALRVMKVRI
jgi:hypothetical protein